MREPCVQSVSLQKSKCLPVVDVVRFSPSLGFMAKIRRKRSYAMIAIDEGFKLYSSLVDSYDADIDDRVQVIMLERNGNKVPYFKKIT